MNIAERKIFAAHQKAGSYCNQGDSPTDALVKVANEQELNPEMVRRVAEMLNISLTRSFMKSAADKTASFPTADSEKAIQRVFADGEVTKTASSAEGEVSGSLRIEILPSRADDHEFFKTARETPRENLQHLVCQAEGARHLLQTEMSKASQDKMASESRAFDLYRSLVGHFTISNNLPDYAAFENQCYSEYGDKVASLLDPIFEHLPEGTPRGDSGFSKKASYYPPSESSRLFDAFMEEIEVSSQAGVGLDKAAGALKDFEDQIGSYYDHALGGMNKAAGSAEQMLDFKKKADFGLGLPLHNPLESAITAHNTADADAFAKGLTSERERLYKQPNEQVDMEMDNVRRQAILSELMSNDEVIGKQKPEHVKSAYETLLQLSPKSTLHREVVRAVLRNATAQQAVDPFTAKQLTDLEGQHIKNKAVAEGKLPPTAP